MAKKKETLPLVQGVVIEPNGTVTAVEVDNSLQTLWRIVGGYVERVALNDGADLFCNEEGRLLDLLPNPLAQSLVETHGAYPVKGHIVGTVLILGVVNASGDSTNVPSWVLEYLTH